MPESLRASIQIGVITAMIVHFVVVTFFSIATFATFEGYIGAIAILLPLSLIVGSSAGITLWWTADNIKPVFVTILAFIGMVSAGICATYISEFIDIHLAFV